MASRRTSSWSPRGRWSECGSNYSSADKTVHQPPTISSTSLPYLVKIVKTSQSTTAIKPYHCTVCDHGCQGHQQRTNQNGENLIHCLYCPKHICYSGGGEIICFCQWCQQHSVHSSVTADNSGGTRYRTTGPIVVFQNQSGDITEWEVSVCQFSVSFRENLWPS